MTIKPPPFMASVFAEYKEPATEQTVRVALSAQSAIDQFAVDTGLLSMNMSAILAAKVAMQLQLEHTIV